MYRQLLAATAALALGIGLLAGGASESAALPSNLETHTQATGLTGTGHGGTVEPDSFDRQIDAWIRNLSGQAEFESWQGAHWTRHPLGPGMHGWLILVQKGGREIGYLVVGATEDGKLKLTEYGAGEQPLFGMQTLYRSLIQLGLIDSNTDWVTYWQASPLPPERIYFSPLHAVWRLANGSEWIYIDAKTGEQLPLSDDSFAELTFADPAAAWTDDAEASPRSVLLETFDPFDNTSWINDKPIPAATAEELFAALDGGGSPVTYTANLYGRKVLAPFAVTGYSVWGGRVPYVRLEQYGSRYIPFETLADYGGFHQNRNGAAD